MLVVRVELHSAITGKVTEIARMLIWNRGNRRGGNELGDYVCCTYIGRDREALDRRKVNREGEVNDHPRLREHVWHLVAKALVNMKYGKRPTDDEARIDPWSTAHGS